jgi:DNA-binding Lrp family transcriptional regulator
MQEIDQRDRELLGALQGEIPLVSTPFALIGQAIDMSEKEVIKRAERLKRDGVVRQIGAQFDARALGYRSCLVAARVDPDRIDDAAAVINAHPCVTQNYRRNNDFNLWFTIACSPSSALGLDRTVEILGEEAGCEKVRALPTLKQFKGGSESDESHAGAQFAPLTQLEIESVRLLQRDLPLQPRPFDALAKTTGADPEALLESAKSLLRRGYIRRYSAVVPPRKSGFAATAMAVWIVPADAVESVGATMAQNRAVSHCYLRPVHDDWPYNVYTIVHGRSVDECESVINDLAIDTGVDAKQALYPTREYKKARISLFSPESDEWEAARSSRVAASA